MTGVCIEVCPDDPGQVVVIANDFASAIGADVLYVPKHLVGTKADHFAAGHVNIMLDGSPHLCKAPGVESVRPVSVIEKIGGVSITDNLHLLSELNKLLASMP